MRDASINLRALPEQRDLIDHAAHLLGKNRSDFMLEAACERAKAITVRVSGQVNQNVNLIGPDAVHQLIVGPLQSASPSIGYFPKGVRHAVLSR